MPGTATASERLRRASAHRREAHRTITRALILRAAAGLLDEAGHDGFSLRRLAERIGYSPAALYRYFPNRDELVIAVLLEGLAAMSRDLRDAAESTPDPAARIEALGRAYVRFGFEHPVMYRTLFMQRPDVWRLIPAERIERECGEGVSDLLLASVDRAVSAGTIRARDVQGTVLALRALLHGIVSLGLAMPELADPTTRDMLVASTLALAEAGLGG